MIEAYRRKMAAAAAEAEALARDLEALGSLRHASDVTVNHVRSVGDHIEAEVYAAMSVWAESASQRPAYQALDGVDGLRTAAAGGDVALMRAAAYAIRDHLRRAAAVTELEEIA